MIKVLPFAVLLLCAATPVPNAVPLRSMPGTTLDATARKLVATDLEEARQAADKPLVLVGEAKLGGPDAHPALFVQLQSPRECGSAGCSTAVFAWTGGAYTRVLDGISGEVSLSPARHRGIADLITSTEHYIWDGHQYQDSRPAPNVELRPRTRHPGPTPRR